jgi:glycosidase
MAVAARDAVGGEHGYDYWQVELPSLSLPTVLYYRFIVSDGSATRYLEDDPALDGGSGEVLADSVDASWQIVVYDRDFAIPDWVAGATVYQIFPDRFANGDESNDPSPDAVPGEEGASRYRYGDVYGNPVLVKAWGDMPEGFCRAYQGLATPCAEEPLGRDFFGGDLAGITQHLDALAELGVTVLYLNPIFAAPSNHRYDTSDYLEIDPDLGTRQDFDELIETAHGLGLKVVLDGVFNHTSSDSPTFDRAHRYSEVGACESADSPYAAWYLLQPGPPAKCFDGQSYVDWFGFDTLAVLSEDPAVVQFVAGDEGVVPYWLEAGIDGWRLDVMNEISHGVLRALRGAAKQANPQALVLGEEWNDASPWLLGTEADGVMNYRFRRAVIGLVNGETADPDGAIAAMSPSAFASAMESVREDYPAPAWNALLNLVDSHDTARILWTLTPGADNPGAKEEAGALAEGKRKLAQVAAIQLTWPGMASIYYGDEVGLTGHDDPDDRRPYPWAAEDAALRGIYQRLAELRRDNPVFADGDLRFLLADDEAGVLAFGRRTDAQAAISVVNLSDAEREISVPVAGYLPAGTTLRDALTDDARPVVVAATGEDAAIAVTLPPRGALVLLTDAVADLAAPAAPSGLSADAAASDVRLAWSAAEGAAGYRVWRSVLAGGGFEPIGATEELSFTDATARPGTTYHYVVTAVDGVDNESARSEEAVALPELTVADARLSGPPEVSQPLSASGGMQITARVTVDGWTASEGPTVGILAQLGFGPISSYPDQDGWAWTAMTFDDDEGDADGFVASLRPEAAARWAVALRVSTDGGTTWKLADRDGLVWEPEQMVALTTERPADTQPPAAPAGLAASVVSDTYVTLIWDAVADDDLLRYEVWRSEDGQSVTERLGTAATPAFTDSTVRTGSTYAYTVVAQDTSFNRSADSNQVVAAAASREVTVTFTLTVPDYTPTGDTVYIAGDFQGWDPGATPMTRVDRVTWAISLPFTEGAAPQYKFTRGSWDAVEKDTGCGEIPNRTFDVIHGTDGTQSVTGEVGKWRDLDECG